jgi:putative membrane protein
MAAAEPEPGAEDATRRTYLAQERTLLAWWRSGLGCFAVAIGIGRLVPALLHVSSGPFVTLGVGFGLLGLAFVFLGTRRDRLVTRYLAEGRFVPMPGGVVWGLAGALMALGIVAMVLLILES